jgi:dGTPase
VARAGESYLHHDRMTHSLKVAQVGRRLTEAFVNDDGTTLSEIGAPSGIVDDGYTLDDFLSPDVVETAALAHDIGHPPFGHIAETELNKQIREEGIHDGFEGNAQSFRYVNEVATHRREYTGLNLTRATLNAMMKYPWKSGEGERDDKWGYYATEEEEFEFARQLTPDTTQKCVEAQIMDWADDVTYAIHDVADFYQSGLIPFDQILEGTRERERFIDYFYDHADFDQSEWDAVDDFLDPNPFQKNLKTPYNGTEEDKSALNTFMSNMVERYLGISNDAVSLGFTDDEYLELDINQDLKREVDFLKSMTIFYVIDSSNLVSQQQGQREIVRHLFQKLSAQAGPESDHQKLITSPFRERLNNLDVAGTETERMRIVVDLIASMTEQQCVEFYKRITGHTSGSLLNSIVN